MGGRERERERERKKGRERKKEKGRTKTRSDFCPTINRTTKSSVQFKIFAHFLRFRVS